MISSISSISRLNRRGYELGVRCNSNISKNNSDNVQMKVCNEIFSLGRYKRPVGMNQTIIICCFVRVITFYDIL